MSRLALAVSVRLSTTGRGGRVLDQLATQLETLAKVLERHTDYLMIHEKRLRKLEKSVGAPLPPGKGGEKSKE